MVLEGKCMRNLLSGGVKKVVIMSFFEILTFKFAKNMIDRFSKSNLPVASESIDYNQTIDFATQHGGVTLT